MSKSCLVTGGAGFIGSHIVDHLLKIGWSVRVLDNLNTGKKENLGHCLSEIDFLFGDVRDREMAVKAVKDMDIIFHHAAVASVPRSVDDPLGSNQVNTDGTLTLLWAANEAKIKRFVYAGSSSAYGDSPELPKTENMAPKPLSPYAVSKLAGEMYCQVFNSLYGLETVVLRYFNVFGPRQDPKSEYAAVVPKFVTAIAEGRSPIIYGDGLQSRDFSYVQNSVYANLLAADAPNAPGQVFNIACGKAYTLLDLISAINKIMGTSVQPQFLPERAGDVKHSMADISKAEHVLNYRPLVSFEDGLAEVVDYVCRSTSSKR